MSPLGQSKIAKIARRNKFMPKDIEKFCYKPKPHFLAFIDALGFAAHIERKASRRVDTYLSLISSTKDTWSKLSGKTPIMFKIIGDSLILALEVRGDLDKFNTLKAKDFLAARKSFWNLCFGVAEIQVQLATKDIWTRGAITYDYLHMEPENDIILGPAFHRAFKLEKSVAKFPRVVIDGGIVSALGCSTSGDLVREINLMGKQGNVLFSYAGIGDPYSSFTQDVPAFVDFLNSPKRNQDGATSLKTIASNISKNLKTDLSHYEKYKWLAEYVCRHISNSGNHEEEEFKRILNLMYEG
jgi:hypothetical protein